MSADAQAARFKKHYMPKNASWLKMVERKLPAIIRQYLHICILNGLTARVPVCVACAPVIPIQFRFSLAETRVKLDRPYRENQSS